MFKAKFIISIFIFVAFLIITSAVKNKTRIIEKKISILNTKILVKKNDINEAQLDFFYLTSPTDIEKKINIIGLKNYQPINFSNIYFNIQEFFEIQNKFSNLKEPYEEKIQKK